MHRAVVRTGREDDDVTAETLNLTSLVAGCLGLSTERMCGITVDPHTRTATVQPGLPYFPQHR